MALTDNIVAYYKFDESSGNAADATGNGYTGTASNISYGTTHSKINNGADFNGSNSSIATSINLNGDFTISGWFYFTDFTTYPWLYYDFSTNYWNISWIVYDDTKKIHFNRGNGTSYPSDQIFTMSALTVATMYHLVIKQVGTTATLYINGTAQPTLTMTYTGATTGQTTYLGIQQPGNADPYKGTMDEVGFWSRGLSDAEVTSLYNGGAGLAYPFGSSSEIKTINGLAIASVKTVNGLSTASVKTVNGLA